MTVNVGMKQAGQRVMPLMVTSSCCCTGQLQVCRKCVTQAVQTCSQHAKCKPAFRRQLVLLQTSLQATRRSTNALPHHYPPTWCACGAPPLPDEGGGGSGTVRHDMAGMMVLLQKHGRSAMLYHGSAPFSVGRAQTAQLPNGTLQWHAAIKQHPIYQRCPIAHPPKLPTHPSGMERMRWLNSLRALMVRPLAGWCAASRISWSQKELISAAQGREGVRMWAELSKPRFDQLVAERVDFGCGG